MSIYYLHQVIKTKQFADTTFENGGAF